MNRREIRRLLFTMPACCTVNYDGFRFIIKVHDYPLQSVIRDGALKPFILATLGGARHDNGALPSRSGTKRPMILLSCHHAP